MEETLSQDGTVVIVRYNIAKYAKRYKKLLDNLEKVKNCNTAWEYTTAVNELSLTISEFIPSEIVSCYYNSKG